MNLLSSNSFGVLGGFDLFDTRLISRERVFRERKTAFDEARLPKQT